MAGLIFAYEWLTRRLRGNLYRVFLLSFSLNKVRQTSEKRRLLKEVSGVLFGISMNFKLAPLRYRTYREKNSLHQVAYATSLLRKAYASIRNPSFDMFWLTQGLDMTQLVLLA